MKSVCLRVPLIGSAMIELHRQWYGRHFVGVAATGSGFEAWAGRVCLGVDVERGWRWRLGAVVVVALGLSISL